MQFSRSLYFLSTLLLFLLPGVHVFAQQTQDDTLLLRKNKVDASGKNDLALDTAVRKKFNPKVATFRSAVIPGWGQAYNKKYWKIPIIYGALGTTAGVFLYNIKTYNILRMAVIYRAAGDSSKVDPEYQRYSTESLRGYRNVLRQNIDYSVLVFLVFWGLNVVDATVDAHLKAFDVSPDISMRLQPGFNYATNTPGISLVFFLKDKHAKPLLSLP